MATRQMRRAEPSDGSRTITVEENQPREEETQSEAESSAVGTLRLRGAPRNRQRVVWREDVVDNEGAGKKKSKICCIYHKPKRFDESSSDESSDDDSDSSCDSRTPRHRRDHDHDHDHDDHGEGSSHGTASRDGQSSGAIHELESEDSDNANAYERQPRKKPKKPKNISNNDCKHGTVPPTSCNTSLTISALTA
ncbi:phosphatase inhibitor-domain-containing protein [Trametes meyenii]|nr:phosphatase inhibitor-domain-containing protein [Trametes meyenii]